MNFYWQAPNNNIIMGPKKNSKSSRGRKSQTKAPEAISIYSLLVLFDNPNPVRDIIHKLEALYRHSPQAVEKSLVIMLLECCGVDQLCLKINWREPVQSLSQLLEDFYQTGNHKKNLVNSDLYLINVRSKFHQQFVTRLEKIIQLMLTEELPFAFETEFLKLSFQILKVLTHCKLRNIRASAIEFSSILVKRKAQYYDQLVSKRNSKKAAKILTILEEGYLEQIITPRVLDIDQSIRQKAFEILENTLLALQMQFINIKKLKQFFHPLIIESKSKKVMESTLKTLINLISSKKMKASSLKNLIKYSAQILPAIEQLTLLPNRNGYLALELLKQMNRIDPEINSLKPKVIGKAFQIQASENNIQALDSLISGFFQSLLQYNDQKELYENRQFLTVQILHLLSSVNSLKLLKIIINQFLKKYQCLFKFEELFILLLTEYYTRDGAELQLHSSNIGVLLQIICQFNCYLKEKGSVSEQKQSEKWIIEEKESYNKHVLTNSKEIFYQKMQKNPSQAHLYLKLFSLVYNPISESFDGYLDFIQERALEIMKGQKYIVMGEQKIVTIQQIVRQCSGLFANIMAGINLKSCFNILNRVFDAFGVNEAVYKSEKEEGSLDDLDVLKISALLSKMDPAFMISIYQEDHQQVSTCPILNEEVFKSMINYFEKTRNKSIKLEIITYIYCVHQLLFEDLFRKPNEQKYKKYISFRNVILEFLFIGVMLGNIHQNNDEVDDNAMIKLAAFTIICKIMKYVSSNKIIDLPIIYYDPSERYLDILVEYIYSNLSLLLKDGQGQGDGETTINNISFLLSTTHIDSISSSNIEIREQILSNMFEMLETCYKIICKNGNFMITRMIAKFLVVGLQIQKNVEKINPHILHLYHILAIQKKIAHLFVKMAQYQLDEQNKNKFVFWKMFDFVMTQITKYSVDMNTQEEQDRQIILGKMVDMYFRYRKNHSQTHKALSDKMMLFVADSIDKSISAKNYSSLATIRLLLKKIYRRYNKQILHRLCIFFTSKVQILENEGIIDKINDDEEQMVNKDEIQIKQLKNYLQKISKNPKENKKVKQKKSKNEETKDTMNQIEEGDRGDDESEGQSEDSGNNSEIENDHKKKMDDNERQGVRTRMSKRIRA